jgi:hypothetical protein
LPEAEVLIYNPPRLLAAGRFGGAATSAAIEEYKRRVRRVRCMSALDPNPTSRAPALRNATIAVVLAGVPHLILWHPRRLGVA